MKQDIFVSTFRCFLTIFAFIPYWLIMMIVLTIFFGWWGFGATLLMPFLGIWGLKYKDWTRQEWNKLKFEILKLRNNKAANELVSMRNEILRMTQR